MDSYKNGAFSTATEKLPMPRNLQTTIVDAGTIRITWEKDITHESYELVYTDKNGDKKTIPVLARNNVETNSITISGLDSTFTYPFTLVAKGTSKTIPGKVLVSDPAGGSFTTKAAEPCSQPLVVRATVNADSKGFKLSWVNIPEQTGAEIRYRKVMLPEALWTTHTVTGLNELEIKDLIPKAQYEYKAKPLCSTGTSTEEAGGFVTLTKDKVKPDVAYQCGKSRLTASNNTTPLDVPLEVGDYILIGDFPAQIDRLQTGSAPYKGLAHVLVPYLGMSNYLMAFTGLTVNTDYEVLAGEMHSITDPVALAQIKQQNAERIKQQVEAVKQVIADAKEMINEIGSLFAAGKPVSKEKYEAYVQKEGQIISEIRGSSPELADAMEKNRNERNVILAKYPSADAGSPDLNPITDPADQAKYNQLAKEMADLNEQSKWADEALSVRDILDFLDGMNGCYEAWKAQEKGIIPVCLWDNLDVVSPYMAGFVDRGWEMASGADVRALIGNFDDMYCAYNWIARKVQRQINIGACRNMSEEEAREIRKRTEETLRFVAKFVTDNNFKKQVWVSLSQKVNQYLEDVPTNKEKQYQIGGLIFDAASILGPIAIKAASSAQLISKLNSAFNDIKFSKKFVVLIESKEIQLKKGGDELATLLLRSGEDFAVLTNARNSPGTVIGTGKNIAGNWLRGTERNAALFPKSVANKLRAKTFNNFDEFRQAFWREIAADPSLANQFDAQSIQRMSNGLSPFTNISQQLGGQKNYVLHHKIPINQGGGVYDVDNLYIVTPKYHKEILDPAYHYGYGY